ncbi:MAG: T9SS type A sorting domain-containing protein, partial [Ignavibacteriaceae bacterium]
GWVSHSYEPKIYRTYNGGLTWNTFNTNLQEPFKLVAFAQLNEGYAITAYFGKVYRSTDNGETWQFTDTTLTNQKKLKMYVNGIGWSIGNGIWRTEDGGFSWTQQLAGSFVDAHFFNKDKGWVIGKVNETNVLFRTIDGGNNWDSVEVPYTQGSFVDLDFVDELHGWIYAHSWNSNELLRTTNGGVTFVEDERFNNKQPTDFTLQQNYPNPFNPSTIISYQLPVAGNVSLKVFDVLGREVATLVDEYRDAGSYNVQFTMNNVQLSSGIYFYQLKAGEFVETKKMLLIK